jgi:ribosome maturation factor RimP
MTPDQLEQIRRFAEEIATREGVKLYDLEFHTGGGRALRVFIERESGGVSIQDCSNVSKGLNLRLDVEDVIPGGAYDLVVSSPGLYRKLTQLWHFAGAVGETVQVKFKGDDGSVQNYEGQLKEVIDEKLHFENNKGPFELEFAKVEKAKVRLADPFTKNGPKGKKKS